MAYGEELIVDMYGCNPELFTRVWIKKFLIELCNLIGMERCDLHFWDYTGYPEEKAAAPIHLDGTTAVQFIKTSNITIHTLDKVGEVYLNLFTCKSFDRKIATDFILKAFESKYHNVLTVIRGDKSQCQNI